MIFEKVFQRDDKSFILFYRFILAGVLYFSSLIAYYIRNNTWKLSERYLEGTIYIVLVFLLLSFLSTKENRYIKGTVQWLRVELILLLQTFVLGILLTVLFKITDDYSRIWMVTYVVVSFILFIIVKIIFDYIYARLVSSNTIQRNILLIGDAEACQNIIKKTIYLIQSLLKN